MKNVIGFVVLALLTFSLMALQEPFVAQTEPCRVGYRNLPLVLSMSPDSALKYLPKMRKWYPGGQSDEYNDTVFVRYRDVSQDLVDVPGYGQALPELYLDFTHSKLNHFKAVYKVALDNFKPETVDRVLKSVAASHPQLSDSAFRSQVFAKPFTSKPQPGCQESMRIDTTSSMFQLVFTYEAMWLDSL